MGLTLLLSATGGVLLFFGIMGSVRYLGYKATMEEWDLDDDLFFYCDTV